MRDQPVLNEAEWALVLELLERESHYLPVEIHHTVKRSCRSDLRNRLEVISDMIQRIRPMMADAVLSEDAPAHI